MTTATAGGLSWPGIFRLGLVQASLGSIVVLTTSTLNRVMVVELALPAVLPGVLVALHYAIQILRPRFGHGSDRGGRRTPWIIGGIAVLGVGGILAAAATALMSVSTIGGIALSTVAFLLIGAGVGASGTSLLVLLAALVSPARRAAAATITWVTMIVGFIITTAVVGHLLDPFSFSRLIMLTGAVSVIALLVTILAVFRIEPRHTEAPQQAQPEPEKGAFMEAVKEVWSEPRTRRFSLFVFMSMLAYSAQDLLLEPFAGAVFGLTPGASTQLGSVQHGGVLAGMLLVALVGTGIAKGRSDVLRWCTIAGCIGSALMLALVTLAALSGPPWPLQGLVFSLGLANGVFAVAAIGSMMTLVSQGHKKRDGVRMGVWGAAQALAFGLGGIVGTAVVDLAQWQGVSTASAYAMAFAVQSGLFVVASALAISLGRTQVSQSSDSSRTEPSLEIHNAAV
ncbi:MAG: BCD family MFS transporter [Lysobacterales bacterium]